jgi:formate dehydrogenase iron-sulfur subunit
MSFAILYDATQCVGCLQCEEACAAKNGNPYNDEIAAEKKMSAHKYTAVQEVGDHYMRRLCMHCENPSCASVCPVGALHKTKAGPVLYDASKCMGCRYCMVACPFDVPKYEWGALLPKVRKCIMCYDQLAEGEPTACAAACPTEATIVGTRSALLAEAHRRIEESPDDYLNHVFGEKEVGGTSVLMLSAVPYELFGYRAHYTDEELPEHTWAVLQHVPDIASMGFVLLGGIWWITHRRDDVQKFEAREVMGKTNSSVAVDEEGGES